MREMVRRSIIILAATSLLAACSSGGGGSSPAPATTSSATVSGIVTSTVATASKAATASIDTTGLTVTVASYDTAGNQLDSQPGQVTTGGGYNALVKLSANGGYVVVTAAKEGYAQFQKRVDYQTPADLNLQIALEGITLNKDITVGTGPVVISKSSEPSFDLAVFSYPDGAKKAVAGRSAILAAKSAADATLQMGLSIPASTLPGVSSINAKVNTYDPSTNTLPGSTTATDSSGKDGKMVSLAFDYLSLTDNATQKNIGDVAKALVKAGVTKAATASTTYTRSIYQSSCTNLFAYNYKNTATGGRMVPVWSLNPSSGKWVFIGDGTITDSSNKEIANPTETACKSGGYYLTIMVANTEFQKNYWNLDHIVYDTPTKVCLSGTVTDSTGAPLSDLQLSLQGVNMDYAWGRTDANGKYTLETVLVSPKNTDRTATISYYDPANGYVSAAVNLQSSSYPTCATNGAIQLKPVCSVSGTVLDDTGKGIPYRQLYMTSSSSSFYKGVGTDSAGAFGVKVPCGASIGLYSGGSSPLATFNVNGAVETGEKSDDGKAVVLNPITPPNTPPYAYGAFASSSRRSGMARIRGAGISSEFPR